MIRGLLAVSLLALAVGSVPWAGEAADLEVAELVAAIKQAITDAQRTSKPPSMTIPWIEAEVSYIVRKEGSGGLKMYVVTVDGKYAVEAGCPRW